MLLELSQSAYDDRVDAQHRSDAEQRGDSEVRDGAEGTRWPAALARLLSGLAAPSTSPLPPELAL